MRETIPDDIDLGIRIRAIASDLLGMRYGRHVGFPGQAPGLPASRVSESPEQIDCSSLTAYILLRLYASWPIDARRLYGDLQIMDGARPWSPIEGAVREQIADQVPQPVIGCWHLVQLWRATTPRLEGGHACLVYQPPSGPLWVLESIVRDGIGPGWRRATWDQLTRHRSARIAVLRP